MLSSRAVPLSVDAQHYSSKTPGRLKGRVENAVYPATLNGKGKEVSKTPFRHATLQKDQKQGKPAIITTRPATRPLGDKTPFPNRVGNQQFQTPLPQSSKFTAPLFLEPDSLLRFEKTPESLLRPSSLRKHVRAPRSASKSFETPLNKGHHWDVSDASIVIPEAQIQETVVEDDYDEIEYMPPNTLDLPYQPPFHSELPNYKEIGKNLFKLAHQYPYDDSPVEEISIDEKTVEGVTWNLLALPELQNDDPFDETITLQKQSKLPSTHSSLPTKTPLNITVVKNAPKTRMQGTAVAPKTIPRPVVVKKTSSVASSVVNPKTTTSQTSRPGTSASVATSSVLPTSRHTLRTSTSKSVIPIVMKSNAPVVKRTSSLRGGKAGTASQKGLTETPTAVATTRSVPSRSAVPTATATRNYTRETRIAASARPVQRPTTLARANKHNVTASTSRVPTATAGGFGASKRTDGKGTVVVGDTNVNILVFQSTLELDDDFKFDV